MEGDGTVEVEIHGISSEGAGVGRLPEGKVVFVHRTAPGDRARIRLTEERSSWARGTLVELLEGGPGRREAPCPNYGRCGGCTLEHLEYPAQLRVKGRMVADALERIGGISVEPPEVEPSPDEFRYRSRVTFTLQRNGDEVRAGFHALEAPGTIVEVGAECRLPVEPLARTWEELRGAWGDEAVRLPGGETLRLTLRSVADGVVLVVHGGRGRGRPEELLELVEGLRAVWKEEPGQDGATLLAGDPELREERSGRDLLVRGSAFLQVNRPAAARVHEHVLSRVRVSGESRVVDAYCGVGLLGMDLARQGARVTGIEVNPQAVAAAREAAPDGFRVLEGRVEERLAEALPADLVILNPPRAGLADAVPPTLLESAPSHLVYVSCDQATLARDLQRLSSEYSLHEIRAFDLFPQTAHVEAVAILRRGSPPSGNDPAGSG